MANVDSPDDPVLVAEVQRAIEPYRRMFPPEVVLVMEEILEHALTTHPVGVKLLDRVRPRAARERSDTRPKDGVAEAAPARLAKKAGAK